MTTTPRRRPSLADLTRQLRDRDLTIRHLETELAHAHDLGPCAAHTCAFYTEYLDQGPGGLLHAEFHTLRRTLAALYHSAAHASDPHANDTQITRLERITRVR